MKHAGHLEFFAQGARTGSSGPTLIMVCRNWRSRWRRLSCVGNKRHYRRDGSCVHTDAVMSAAKPEVKPTLRVDPFGRKGAA